ncbi:MAG: hypothetical protein EZS28_007055 [Streblomastix strix]|uniref:Uncharacterized protein n=1 Tax=Streblomastix strix TaxID=222440 RepID=A0A5J4WSL9_9EUKA|nr:MAG: hypothetical protein EZS28_007055 [Streblomastix strix]
MAPAETQEVDRIPDSVQPADGKSIFSKIKQLVQKVGKGLQWANDNVYKPFIKPFAKPILGAQGPVGKTIGKRFLMKATHLQQAGTIKEILLGNAVVSFTNDGEHQYSIKKIKPESQIPALFDKEIIISLSDTDHDITQIQNSFLQVVLTANIQLDDKFDKINESYKNGLVLFLGLKSGSNLIREYTIYHRGKIIDGSLQNDATTESFIQNTIKPKIEKNNRKLIHSLYENIHNFGKSTCGTYINMREVEELIGNQTAIPYTIPIRFRVSIPLDDHLIFSAFTDYPNGLFGDLKIEFKINPHIFVLCQVNPKISMAKCYTMNKDDLLSISQQKLMDIDLMFRNWSPTFQYTKQFSQLGCIADLKTGLHAEPLTESGLKNLVCDIKHVTINIKNYVMTEMTASMAGCKATDACLNRVRQLYSQRPFVVPAQRVEVWPLPTSATLTGTLTSQNIPLSHVTDFCLLFPKEARATTCFENPCYQNIQVTICRRNFPDMLMNLLDQQLFQLQLNASNLVLLFEVTDKFEDALTTPRNSVNRKLNPHTNLISFLITLQCERNSNGTLTFDGLDTRNQNTSVELRGAPIYQGATDSYFSVDKSGKKPPPPILCTVHDTFWLFSPAAGGSCIYNTNYSFDEVIGPLTG